MVTVLKGKPWTTTAENYTGEMSVRISHTMWCGRWKSQKGHRNKML